MEKNKRKYLINQVVKIAGNEYKNIFKDPGTIMLFMIAIVVYPLIYALAYNNELAKEIPVIIVDNSNSQTSRKLISMIDATDEIAVITTTKDFKYAEREFDQSDIYGVINIPNDFEKKIYRFEQASVSVYADAAHVIIYKQILSGTSRAVGTLSAGVEVIRRTSKNGSIEQSLDLRNPLPLEVYSLYNPRGGYATYLMPSVLLLILQQTLLLGIGLLGGTTKENGDGFLVPIGTRPGGAISIVLGKGLAYSSIYLLNSLYVIVIVERMLDIPMRGNYLELIVFVFPFILAVTFMGLTISSFFKRREHALMILLFTSIPFIFLSGFSWPVEAMPKWQVWLSYFIPSTPAVKGVVSITQKGSNFSDVYSHWVNLWALVVFYILTSFLMVRYIINKEVLEEASNN